MYARLFWILCLGLNISPAAIADAGEAQELPLFELGAGPGMLHQHYYPGTKDTRSFAFPAIIPVYRGDTLKSDEEGIRAEVVKDDRIELDLNVELNLAFDSDDVRLRRGMPDVENLLQIGPSLQLTLARHGSQEWRLRLPVRAALELGDGLEEAGFSAAPDITWLWDMNWRGAPWRLGLSLGPVLGTRDFHRNYYGVPADYATAERPAYEPGAGLTHTRFLATFTSRNAKRLTSWFLRLDHLGGATIGDSPLVETDTGITVGFIYSWMLYRSRDTVSPER